jgi:hypothetical protein
MICTLMGIEVGMVYGVTCAVRLAASDRVGNDGMYDVVWSYVVRRMVRVLDAMKRCCM